MGGIPLKKKYDFIPNRLNKYSIRRFSIGTASIFVGATLIFGLGNEAKADETEGNTTDNKFVGQESTASQGSESNKTSDLMNKFNQEIQTSQQKK